MVWSEWVLLVLALVFFSSAIGELFGWHKKKLPQRLKKHFGKSAIANLSIATRTFPYRVRADLQRCVDDFFRKHTVDFFSAIVFLNESLSITDCVQGTAMPAAPKYEAVNVGGDETVSVMTTGLWLFDFQGTKTCLLYTSPSPRDRTRSRMPSSA